MIKNNVDFHLHVLPGMDDGAKDLDESAKMLSVIKAQGIDKIVATPHFLPHVSRPEEFLKQREEAKEKIIGLKDRPKICLGAEIEYFAGIGTSEEMRKLCIEGTEFMIIEMPSYRWDTSIFQDIANIHIRLGCTPIIAHIDRYFGYQRKKEMLKLREKRVLFQLNADEVIEHPCKAFWYIKNGFADIFGSDAHNVDKRPPQLDKAFEKLETKLEPDYFYNLEGLSENLLKHAVFY